MQETRENWKKREKPAVVLLMLQTSSSIYIPSPNARLRDANRARARRAYSQVLDAIFLAGVGYQHCEGGLSQVPNSQSDPILPWLSLLFHMEIKTVAQGRL